MIRRVKELREGDLVIISGYPRRVVRVNNEGVHCLSEAGNKIILPPKSKQMVEKIGHIRQKKKA